MENAHVLIIDDDKDTADLFSTILNLVGFECEAVYSAKTAFAYLATREPDIILLDMRLGLELDGKDILYQIRSNPRFDKTRVIVVTAFPRMLENVDSVADLILLKPIEIKDLTTLASRLTQIRPKSYLFRDPTTNLYSLNFFMTRLEHAYERGKRHSEFLFAVMVIECNFDLAEGEKVEEKDSEQLLVQFAEILNRDFRPTDTFGYLNGHRVVALYEDFKKPQDIYVVIQRLNRDLSLDVDVGGKPCHCTPRIGAVLSNARFQSADEMLKVAIGALDEATHQEGEFYSLADPFNA